MKKILMIGTGGSALVAMTLGTGDKKQADNLFSMLAASTIVMGIVSTIIGWYFFGEQNVKYLFGVKAVKVYACIAVVCVALGAVLEAPLVWNLSDLFNALMVFPNLLAPLALSGLVAKAARGGDALRK